MAPVWVEMEEKIVKVGVVEEEMERVMALRVEEEKAVEMKALAVDRA